MQQRRGRRRQNPGHAQNDKREIKAHNEAVVAADARHELGRELSQGHKLEEVLRGDRNVGDLSGNRGSRRDGDAGVGFRECGRVVHAVADHDDRAPGGLFRADEGGLILRQHLGVDLIHADLRRDGLGSLAIIACHHDDLVNAACMQRAHCVGSLLA